MGNWLFIGRLRSRYITSWVNGTKVQDNISLPNKTGAGKLEEPILLPIRFQDHGDPVRFRNAWIVDRGLVNSEFPVSSTQEQRQAANKAFQQRMKSARKKRAQQERELKKSLEEKSSVGEASEATEK